MDRTQGTSNGIAGRPWLRRVASVLLFVHLLAVFSAPWANPPPASLLAERVSNWFRPYLIAAFLNHGYRFFAPNPGPSHLLRYEIDREGRPPYLGQVPHVEHLQPRLRYHRYFMLSEFAMNLAGPFAENPPPGVVLTDQEQRAMDEARARVRQFVEPLARQLMRRHQGQRIRVYLVRHLIPMPEDIEQGMRLNDPRLYAPLFLIGQFTTDST